MSEQKIPVWSWGGRQVVTGNAGPERSVFLSDSSPERDRHLEESPLKIWQLPKSPGGSGFAAHGRVTWQIAHLSGGTEATALLPGAKGPDARESLEFNQVLEGRAELVLDEGSVGVRPGDTVVRRGAAQRWRVLGDSPFVCSSIVLEGAAVDDPSQPSRKGVGTREQRELGGEGPRRIVTGVGGDGRSCIERIGEPPNAFRFEHGGGMAYADLWQTMGDLYSATAGGDAPEGSIQLLPHGDGVAWKRLVVPTEAVRVKLDRAKLGEERRRRAAGLSRGGQRDRGQPGRHRTDTIDLVQILEGELRLSLDPKSSVDLAAGDCVVQQGTWHTWTNCGEVPCVFDVVMVTTDPR